MHSFRRTAAAVAAGTILLGLAASPARAAANSYVALGDSYSSGTGTRSYLADGTSCQRSVYAFPSLVASSRGLALNFRACSGATVADVTRLQLSALGTGTAFASLSVGGNDAGFAAVLTECAKPAWASDCNGAIDRAQTIIDTQLPSRLGTLYAAVRNRAPQARIVVVGYPRIFNGEDCNLLTWFSPSEESRLNATADRLNSRIQAAANGSGVTYKSPTSAFDGHAVCDDTEWINGLSSPSSESFHPNRRGHSSGYTPLVGSTLTGSQIQVTAQTSRDAIRSADRLTKQQLRYATADRTIPVREFKVPDLSSPQIKRAAARAGVDLGSRASINTADQKHAARQADLHRARVER